jgi:hypothetical protein
MFGYIRPILAKWGGLTLLFAIVRAVSPAVWLNPMYRKEMVQYGYMLRL